MSLCSFQPFLAKLQSLIKENSTAVEELRRTEAEAKSELNAKHPTGDLQDDGKLRDCDLDVKKTQIHFDPEVVQIKAGKAEVSLSGAGWGGDITFKSSVVF